MCLIIDANCAAETLTNNPSPDFNPVITALMSNKAVMVRGGTKLIEEYKRVNSVWRFIALLDRAGKSIVVSTSEVDRVEQQLLISGSLKSDDPHIIALAQVSGARLLCSKDQALHEDFGNKALIDKPRGSIYQKSSHSKLLKKCSHQQN
jgi:hypothetical protein